MELVELVELMELMELVELVEQNTTCDLVPRIPGHLRSLTPAVR